MADSINLDEFPLVYLQTRRQNAFERMLQYQIDWNQRFSMTFGENRRKLQDEFRKKSEIYHRVIAMLDDAIHERELFVQPLKGILTTAEIVIHGKENRRVVRALFDSGSETSYISMELADELGLKKICHPTESHGIGPVAANEDCIANAEIRSKNGDFKKTILFVVNNSKLRDHPLERLNRTGMGIPNNIELADPNFDAPGTVDVMLGAMVQLQIFRSLSLPFGQILMKSHFGWVVGGHSEPVERDAM